MQTVLIFLDGRRLFRPFFMSTDGKSSAPSKVYYDSATWLITQVAFSFTVAPFILLSLDRSIIAWARVYFYCIIGVLVSMAVFSSPAVGVVRAQLNKRQRPQSQRVASSDSIIKGGQLGLPEDPGQDLDELMDEIRKEVELRRTRGMSISQGLQEAVQDRLKARDQLAKGRST